MIKNKSYNFEMECRDEEFFQEYIERELILWNTDSKKEKTKRRWLK